MSGVPLTAALLNERNSEVASYLELLKIAVERRATLIAKDGALVYPLSQELTHTLKANLVLLLYSVTEATLIQLLDEMHDAIGSNCSSADALNSELLRAVIKSVKKDKSTTVLASAAPLHQSLFSYWISDWQSRTSAKDKRVDGISGSVDGLVFYEQLKKFGVVAPTPDDKPPSHLTSPALQIVKKRRNLLAHGEKSFTDLGRDLSVESLETDAIAVFDTLQRIAVEVDKYLRDQRYLAQPPAAPAVAPVADTDA